MAAAGKEVAGAAAWMGTFERAARTGMTVAAAWRGMSELAARTGMAGTAASTGWADQAQGKDVFQNRAARGRTGAAG